MSAFASLIQTNANNNDEQSVPAFGCFGQITPNEEKDYITEPEQQPTSPIADNLSFCSGGFGGNNDDEDKKDPQQDQNLADSSPNPFDNQQNVENVFSNPFGKSGFGFDDEFENIKEQPVVDNEQQGSVFARQDENLFGSFCSQAVPQKQPQTTMFQKLGIKKLEPIKKKKDYTESVIFEKYENQNQLEFDISKAQQQNKSNLGNKISTRSGGSFISVMKQRAIDSRQRLTIGHKTPLQRRLLIQNITYDQKSDVETENTNPFKVILDGPIRERGGQNKINYVDNSYSSNPFLQSNKKPVFKADSPVQQKTKVPTTLPSIDYKQTKLKKKTLSERIKMQSGWGQQSQQ